MHTLVDVGYSPVNALYWTAETEAAITTQEIPMNNIIQLRPVGRKRLDRLQERTENPLTSDNIGYVHTVLSQCFLPYKDPKTPYWKRKNGKYSILLTAGVLDDPDDPTEVIPLGLPYGAKPRLFQSYV